MHQFIPHESIRPSHYSPIPVHLFIKLSIHQYIPHESIRPSRYSSIHLSFHTSVHPPHYSTIHPYIYPSTLTAIHPCIHLPIQPPINSSCKNPFVYSPVHPLLSIQPSTGQSFYLHVHIPIHISIFSYVYLTIGRFLQLSVNLLIYS